GTLGEQDVGLADDSACWRDAAASREVARAMAGFLWQASLSEAYQYAEWIDRGRPRPTHRQWSAYLRWVAERAAAEIVHGEVYSLLRDETGGRWHVRYHPAPATGPRPARARRALAGPHT